MGQTTFIRLTYKACRMRVAFQASAERLSGAWCNLTKKRESGILFIGLWFSLQTTDFDLINDFALV